MRNLFQSEAEDVIDDVIGPRDVSSPVISPQLFVQPQVASLNDDIDDEDMLDNLMSIIPDSSISGGNLSSDASYNRTNIDSSRSGGNLSSDASYNRTNISPGIPNRSSLVGSSERKSSVADRHASPVEGVVRPRVLERTRVLERDLVMYLTILSYYIMFTYYLYIYLYTNIVFIF